MKYPKVLIIANNSFSLTDSNGRTIGNFFQGWPKDRLAQFCIIFNDPNWDLCDNYYCVSDKAALMSLLGIKMYGRAQKTVDFIYKQAPQFGKRSTIKKTALSALIRQLVWSIGLWKRDFKKWVDLFNPEVVLVVSGDAGFMLDLGRKVSQDRSIPLVIYNSENYYFKDKDFMRPTLFHELIYKIYHKVYRQSFVKFIKQATKSIYINDALKEVYENEFDLPSEVIYTSSSIEFVRKEWNRKAPRFAYLGNLGVNRHKSLIDIAVSLNEIDENFKLEIYGRIPDDNVKKAFDSCPAILYCGVVSYEEVVNIIHQVDIIFHIESFDSHYIEDLHYAFSTKIADSLASGTNFVLYAPSSLACTEYIKENDCAWLITDRSEIKQTLIRIIANENERERILENAYKVANQNHKTSLNIVHFQKIIMESINC